MDSPLFRFSTMATSNQWPQQPNKLWISPDQEARLESIGLGDSKSRGFIFKLFLFISKFSKKIIPIPLTQYQKVNRRTRFLTPEKKLQSLLSYDVHVVAV